VIGEGSLTHKIIKIYIDNINKFINQKNLKEERRFKK